ncbi:putative saccharopine dehydrogenase [Aspergillus fischeri NRRL 181]|uniref:Saccharopine dehydrogenase, putative n=1 Tax=Neosartorya fischeri (strain ATCC 1020 / DSM 3700 / CBS 544.65 / FGSC A1164 / JCM 1740 / NRRL 181 / WB 181) TaxID=331117 RepID=A1CZ79_NEOFI|nr:saccharopine dehydrogenase, putative [Aspergillus fischeri NRRL 181]EAW24049.1 saccharopine dehydrogenase, putative [Aspergillus fischeri NRRL 181]
MSRPYDLIVHGATGYLGSLVVQYLWANSPPTLRWAVAGRSEKKLVALANSLDQSLHRRSKSFSSRTESKLRAACIENSTAYVDSTGEHVWTQQLAAQWHDKAIANKAIIIPQCAVESSPPDLMTLLLARRLHRPLGPVFFTIQHTWTGYSGGTIASILAGIETYSIGQMMAASAPHATCIPDAGPHNLHPPLFLPVRRDRVLGILTFNPSAMADQAVVMRTWSLLQRYGRRSERYGERFSFQGYTAAPSWLQAWSSFLAISVAAFCVVVFPPLRWLLQWLSPQPGTGPRVTGENHFVEWKATVAVDGEDVSQPSAVGVMRMDTDMYSVCATLVSEAALTLLEVLDGDDNGSMVKELGGGILTPASLGMLYVERLETAGLQWKVTEIGKDK